MIRTFVRFAVVWSLMMGAGWYGPLRVPVAHAQEDWKAEFDDICSKTVDAMSLPKEEIKSLVQRCDALKPRIEKLEESAAKVYLKRLKMCKDLFVFVLESSSK
jgi:hypothetical protein